MRVRQNQSGCNLGVRSTSAPLRSVRDPERMLGMLAMKVCGLEWLCILTWLLLPTLALIFSVLPLVGGYIGPGIAWLLVILAPCAALVSVVLGLTAAVKYGLIARKLIREALLGLLASFLSATGALFTWWFFIAPFPGYLWSPFGS